MNNIILAGTEFRPGETIKGQVSWQLDKPPQDLELRLFWHTRGRGTEEAETVGSRGLGTALQGSSEFSFTLPASPWSVDGQLVSICWALELVDKKAGGLALAEFTMAPGGKPLVLGKVDKPESESGFWQKFKPRSQR
ncbi:hypothetical protein [Haloferula sp. BvORR071]|uniref:hypothetical protein n=1 Tax=Haloferula sp. BvORR071 TaxID=1396141 RepID=UPI00055597D8|nr:hypothetical protein [Haloferula sp. BvORR071]